MSAVSSSPEFKVSGFVESICDGFEALSPLFPSPTLDDIGNLTKGTRYTVAKLSQLCSNEICKTSLED